MDDSSAANALHKCSHKITDTDGYKVCLGNNVNLTLIATEMILNDQCSNVWSDHGNMLHCYLQLADNDYTVITFFQSFYDHNPYILNNHESHLF